MITASFFLSHDTAPTEIYTLSLHDALPILCIWAGARAPRSRSSARPRLSLPCRAATMSCPTMSSAWSRSEEHTSELQSRGHLVCRLLLEKKKHMAARTIDYGKRFLFRDRTC